MINSQRTAISQRKECFIFSLLFFASIAGALWPCVLSKFVVYPPNITEQDLGLGYKPKSPCKGPGVFVPGKQSETLNASAVVRMGTRQTSPHTLLFCYSLYLPPLSQKQQQ